MDNIQPLKYGQQIYFFTPYNLYLFGRGFINRNVYLSEQKSSECVFVFQQKSKNNTKNYENHDTIIYGTELVIKHVFSGHFLCIQMVENEPQLFLSKDQNESCYFELTPQRNFEQNGQIVTLNSFFGIQSSHYNLKQYCISSFLRSDKQSRFTDRAQLYNSGELPNSPVRHTSQLQIGKTLILHKHHKYGKHQHPVSAKHLTSSLHHHHHHSKKPKDNNSQEDECIETNVLESEELSYSSDDEEDYDDNIDEEEERMNTSKQSKVNYYTGKPIKECTTESDEIRKTTEILVETVSVIHPNADFKKIKKTQSPQEESPPQQPKPTANPDSKVNFLDSQPQPEDIFSYLNYFNPLSQKNLIPCKIQTNEYSFWKVDLKPQNKNDYLQDNDYVQFIYSNKNDGILNVGIESVPFLVKYEMTKGEEEELFSSFFVVEIEGEKMFLKHILTNLYFPLNPKNEKVEFELIPVCYQENNQLPVFEIKFGGKVFQPLKSDIVTLLPFDEYKTDAFFVNKVEKYPINEILSCEGVSEKVWIKYFKEYLNKKGKKGQKILKETQLLKYMVEVILPRLKEKKTSESLLLRQQAYKLLFKACLFNPPIKRYLIENHIEQILKEKKKEFINDLIIELLQNGQGLLQKYITPEVIGNVIRQMSEYIETQKKKYSMSYMRLFRIFCGTDSQSCSRNQNIMFNYFFTGKRFNPTRSQKEIPITTESYRALTQNRSIQISEEQKFLMIEKENTEIVFRCNGREKTVEYFLMKENEKEKDYLRQYFYLLADTMRNENSETIEKFVGEYDLKLLIKILTHPRAEYSFLKGPILSLILTAYIAQVTKFKFYIFYSMYPKICYKGKLLAQNISDNYTKLLQYMNHQIHTIYFKEKMDKTQFNSTTFKHFLSLIKLSIECALWNDENQLLDTIQWLEKIFELEESLMGNHENYQEKLQASNLMNCKILAVEIYTLYVDMQINMCISELLEESQSLLTNQIISDKITDFYRKSCNWNLNKLIFKICSTSNSELMKKSLFLFKKIYNIKTIVEEEFNEARKQLKLETESMKDKIGFIKSQNNAELSINTQEDCENFIAAIFSKAPNEKQISLSTIKSVIQNGQNVMIESIYGYEKPNHQFQELCFKLGIHTRIIQTLISYLNLRKKQQDILKKDTLSNQLFLLLALIKSNEQLKEVIAQHRHLFINLLSDESQLYYIGCQILVQIYEQNRKLVVSDTKNLQKICTQISDSLKKGTYHLKNKIDMHHSTKEKIQDQFRRSSIKRVSSGDNSLIENTEPSTLMEEMSIPVLSSLNRCESFKSGKEQTLQMGLPNDRMSDIVAMGQNSVVKDTQCYRYVSKKESIFHVAGSKSLTVKDCKLFFFLLIFLRIQNKRIEKNEKIILKYIFNKDNLVLIEEKIKTYEMEDNLIEIFKVLIYHLLDCLGKNPDLFFTPIRSHQSRLMRKNTSMACIQGGESTTLHYKEITPLAPRLSTQSYTRIHNLSTISQKSLNNLIMSIRFKNWDLKGIVYKILENKVKHFKISELKELMKFIQMDLCLFCEMIHTGQAYILKDGEGNWKEEKVVGNGMGQEKKKHAQLNCQVEAFVKCSPFIIKTIENIIIKLRSTEKQVRPQVLSLLLINVQRLFLLRSIFSLQNIQNIENLPINLEPLLKKHERSDPMFKSIDLINLYKISVTDWDLKELLSQKFKNSPLIADLENRWEVLNRDKTLKGKNTHLEELLPEPFLLLLQKKISHNPNFVKFPQKTVIFPTQKQILKNFILNLIKVNSSDSNVLSDQLKTFFLTYLSHSYLQPQTQKSQDLSSILSNPNKVQTKIKLIDKDRLPEIMNDEELEKKQDLLIEYEIPLMICTILEEGFRNRYDLFCNMFELVNRLLEGGNTKGQNKFLVAFKDDHKNTIFQNISTMITDILQTICFYYTNQNLIPLGFHSSQSSYQFYQSKYERKVVCKLLCDVFRFLQLLCENNNRKMKNYIFSQYDEQDKIKYLSVNFVHIGIWMLNQIVEVIESNVVVLGAAYQKELLKEVKEYLLPIPNSILDFLIEVCQIPALQNQIYLCKTDFFKVISKIEKLSEFNSKFIARAGPLIISNPQQIEESLSKLFFVSDKQRLRGDGSPLSENILFTYQRKLIILFRSLLEQENQEIISIMNKKLSNKEFEYFINESLLHGGLEDIEKLKVLLLETKLNHHLETIVDVLIVKRILKINNEFSFTGIKKEIIMSLQRRIQSININFQHQNLTVYFPSHPLFDLLTDRTKKFFLDKSIVLKSRNQKLRDFIVSRHVIYQDIENEKNAQNKIMNDRNMHRLCNLSIGISYVIILLLILFYSVSKAGTVLDVLQTQIISGISLMQVIVTVVYSVLWGINIAPITKEKLKTKQFQMTRNISQSRKNKKQQSQPSLQQSGYLRGNYLLTKYWTRLKQDLFFVKQIYLQQSASFHVVLLLLVSLVAFFVEFRVYSFTLIFIFAKIQLLESILKAIRLTWKQLLIVCLLAVVFSFIFGFLTINNYIVPLYENQEIDIDINRINEHCNSISSCIKSLYTQQIIGESVNQDGDENQFISDLVYWGFFEILLTNIIAAIIIDKFAEQRNSKEKIENQRNNRCYICSADKSTLQRKGIDFVQHINKTHYLWNYFYYMYSLERLKDSTQFTGIEYWIEHQIKNCKIEWIPLDESKRDDFTEQKIDYLYNCAKKSHSSHNSIHDQNRNHNSSSPHHNKHHTKTKKKSIQILKTFKSEGLPLTNNMRSELEDSEFQMEMYEKLKKRKARKDADQSAGHQSED